MREMKPRRREKEESKRVRERCRDERDKGIRQRKR